MDVGWDSLRVRWKRSLDIGVEEVVVVLISGEAGWECERGKMPLEMASECRRREGRVLLVRRVFERLNITYLFLWTELIIDDMSTAYMCSRPQMLVLWTR